MFSTGKNERNVKRNKTKDAKFYEIKTNLQKVQAETKVIPNFYRLLKYNKGSFLISTVERLSSELRFKKCFGTFLKSTKNKETKIILLNN